MAPQVSFSSVLVLIVLSCYSTLPHVQSTKLDGSHHHGNHHHHHHDDHHHDNHHHDNHHHDNHHHDNHHHDHHHDNQGTASNTGSVRFPNTDVFAKALAAEVKHGLFSALPNLSNSIQSQNGNKESRNFRGATKFQNPLINSRKQVSQLPRNKNKLPKTLTNTRNNQFTQTRRNLRNTVFSNHNQELPTHVSHVRSNQILSAQTEDLNRIDETTIIPETSDDKVYNDTTGFAPRAPPPTAKQFNPFSFSKSTSPSQNQQLSNFRFRANSNVKTQKTFDDNVAIQSEIVESATETTVQFNKNDEPATDNSIIRGFAPVKPPATAQQFNPFPGVIDNHFDFNRIVTITTTPPEFSTTISDISDTTFSENLNTNTFNVGKSLDETNKVISQSNAGRALDDNAHNQQINVLGALSSTGNVLNSPKYTSAGLADVTVDHSVSLTGSTVTPSPFETVPPSQSFDNSENTNIAKSQVQAVNTFTAVLDDSDERVNGFGSLDFDNDYGSTLYDTRVELDNQLDADDTLTRGRQLVGFQDSGEYPQYGAVPATSFSCGDHKYSGYYADPEAGCQVFHICHNSLNLGSFLCPNGTLFHQNLFVCDWWYNVQCDDAQDHYDLNKLIGAQGSDETR